MYKVRQIETIKPDHWTIPIFSVIMPVHCWRQNHIPALHFNTLALHRSVPAMSLDDKAAGKSGVAVCWGGLIWVDELKTAVYRIGSEWRLFGDIVTLSFQLRIS
jgi:hypothetical protein